ncbi:MAG: hypothetical protein OXR67_16755 [Chloroflexota bacterium]|nr:hypothetical protein [Chloroflexota bacterium]
MDVLRMLLALVLMFCAIAVSLQFVLGPLYSGIGQAELAVWYYLDMLMAFSIVATLLVQLQRKRAADRIRGDSLNRERLEANVMFFLALLVALWFFRNWFDFLSSNPIGDQSVATIVIWYILDPLLVILVGLTGIRLWHASAPTAAGSGGARG